MIIHSSQFNTKPPQRGGTLILARSQWVKELNFGGSYIRIVFEEQQRTHQVISWKHDKLMF